jgi:hypothetical protein
LHHIALIDEITDLGLDGLSWEIDLNDRGICAFNGDRTRGGYNLSYGFWCKILNAGSAARRCA